MRFDNNKLYASCHNPGGFFSMPVGEVFILTKGSDSYMSVAFSDSIYGEFLNWCEEKYGELEQVMFVHDGKTELLL